MRKSLEIESEKELCWQIGSGYQRHLHWERRVTGI